MFVLGLYNELYLHYIYLLTVHGVAGKRNGSVVGASSVIGGVLGVVTISVLVGSIVD